jgi:hypothetical protein
MHEAPIENLKLSIRSKILRGVGALAMVSSVGIAADGFIHHNNLQSIEGLTGFVFATSLAVALYEDRGNSSTDSRPNAD